MEVVSAGIKDPDSEVEDPGSSALMRASVAMNDFERFTAGLPTETSLDVKKQLFSTLKKIMGVNENIEAWRIAPELDNGGLRWNYKNNGLYEVGTYVENLNTGLVGEINVYIFCDLDRMVFDNNATGDVLRLAYVIPQILCSVCHGINARANWRIFYVHWPPFIYHLNV